MTLDWCLQPASDDEDRETGLWGEFEGCANQTAQLATSAPQEHRTYVRKQSPERRNSRASPSSGDVIPISMETFVNYPPPSMHQRYDGNKGGSPSIHANIPRHTSSSEAPHSSPTADLYTSNRPAVIQRDSQKPTGLQDGEYSVTPSVRQEPRESRTKHVYSVHDGTASLVANVHILDTGEKHYERAGSGLAERERGRKRYHLSSRRARHPPTFIEDDDAYSYTNVRGMFDYTEPRWRERDARRHHSADSRSYNKKAAEEPWKSAPPHMDNDYDGEPALSMRVRERSMSRITPYEISPYRSTDTTGSREADVSVARDHVVRDDPDEDYRHRKEQVQRELERVEGDSEFDPDRERRRREREQRLRERQPRNETQSVLGAKSVYSDALDASVSERLEDSGSALRRKPSILYLDDSIEAGGAQIIDNSPSARRENLVKIVDPPTEEDNRKPQGILKKPKETFPDYPNEIREGVAPLKDAKSGIPPSARWTKIDRRLVNPEALEEAKERFEERLDCVVVLRVLTKEEIQRLADRTEAIRDLRHRESTAPLEDEIVNNPHSKPSESRSSSLRADATVLQDEEHVFVPDRYPSVERQSDAYAGSNTVMRKISPKETTYAELETIHDGVNEGDDSHKGEFVENAEHQSDTESIDVASERSFQQSYAASSSISASHKGSSTQPTTAGISKQGSVDADNDKARRMDSANDNDDAESIKTDNREIEMQTETKLKLSRYFAAELYASMRAAHDEGYHATKDALSALPELLRQFSLLAEQRVRSSLEQRAAAFVRHRRNAIAACFQLECGARTESDSPKNKFSLDEPDFVERMGLLWSAERSGTGSEMGDVPSDRDLTDIRSAEDEEQGADEEGETDEEEGWIADGGEEGTTFAPDIEIAIDFLLAGEECQWLLNELRVASQIMATGNDFMKVRRYLTESLGDYRRLVFEVFWNPLAFVQQQYESIELFDLGSVVCISGRAELAQATTCKQYIEMMWPTTGAGILSTVTQFIRQALELPKGVEIDDNPSCIDHMTFSNDRLSVHATGSQVELLEAGEVLTWLGAACRASNSDSIAYCSPRVTGSALTHCKISYNFEGVEKDKFESLSNNKCWLKIFNNPTIVRGYPIRSREQEEPGLEIPLNMAAVLGYAQFATSFNDHFLLKGPCSALTPRMQKGPSIIWHYTVNNDQEPLTYEQAIGRRSNCTQIDPTCLEDSRHFVGWTPSVRLLTGTKYAEYDNIGYGGPFIEKSGHALSEVTIGGGYKCFSIGGTFVPGKKDYHHFQGISGPYQLQIRLAGQYNVVLYDAADRRGWLLDGTSFVLHLARAALSHPLGHFAEDSADRLIQQFIHLDQISNATKRTTAKDVLLNAANRQILMFQDPYSLSSESEEASAWRFEDLVTHYCNILDKIRGHQIKLQQSHQWKVQNPLAKPKTLEGFGFLDILQMEPDLRPRAVKLNSSASHWLKMTEKAGAINILGSNFGDLMAPLQEQCQHQLQVPCGVDFLAAPVGILQQIALKRCGMSEGSYQLADGIVWAKPSTSFANAGCFCSDNQKMRTCNLTQKPRECNVHVTELGQSTSVQQQNESRDSKSISIDYKNGAIIVGRRCDLAKAVRRPKRPSIYDSENIESQYEADKASHDSGIDVNSIGRSSTS